MVSDGGTCQEMVMSSRNLYLLSRTEALMVTSPVDITLTWFSGDEESCNVDAGTANVLLSHHFSMHHRSSPLTPTTVTFNFLTKTCPWKTQAESLSRALLDSFEDMEGMRSLWLYTSRCVLRSAPPILSPGPLCLSFILLDYVHDFRGEVLNTSVLSVWLFYLRPKSSGS
jgi:hypothetical protein